ncbi:MAG: hypothetical protein LUC43_01760 [Burkholderiales bacterium]|nr:hypothetical protein [Burkholderiales bacterium]
MVSTRLVVLVAFVAALGGCQATGEQYRANVYGANQVNQAQEVQTVDIIALQPAKIVVNNQEYRAVNQGVGAVIGAILGGVIGGFIDRHGPAGATVGALAGAGLGAGTASYASPATRMVKGVQITFRVGERTFNSAQVGEVCEYRLGPAIMTSTSPTSTRIQPNNSYGCGEGGTEPPPEENF